MDHNFGTFSWEQVCSVFARFIQRQLGELPASRRAPRPLGLPREVRFCLVLMAIRATKLPTTKHTARREKNFEVSEGGVARSHAMKLTAHRQKKGAKEVALPRTHRSTFEWRRSDKRDA